MRASVRALPVLLSAAALAFTLGPGTPSGPATPSSKASTLAASAPAASTQDASTPAADGPAVPLERERPTRIMPLGDSITAGHDAAKGGYRTDLYQLLAADGRPIDFVGSVASGSAALADKDNEGHGGWTIGMVQDKVAGWLTTYTPDVVTIQLGTNDMYNDASAGAAPGRLSTLLDTIATTLPAARIFVSSIPPINDPNHYSRVNAFNATIPGLVATKVAAGKQIAFVDTNPSFSNPFDLTDALHPNYGALSKAATRWYGALTGVPLTRLEAEQSANATVVHARRTQITSASGGAKIGYIDYADSSVTFTFQVPAAGTYRIRARGANGTGSTCTHQVSANNGPQATITYPSYGWALLAVASVDLPLTAGPNTVKFTKGVCYAELDAIDLSPVPSATGS
ncbi:GDSL-type esterase/lipase family protein [Kribbella sp. CA-247076]|uniref:GDSL-type esterase/lipase family protein n=1 Tax=Kribbella sp. CA-247076 TaxID=3239941 RepID=UPI003D8A36A3